MRINFALHIQSLTTHYLFKFQKQTLIYQTTPTSSSKPSPPQQPPPQPPSIQAWIIRNKTCNHPPPNRQQNFTMQKQMQETKGTEVSFPIILSSVKQREDDSNRSLFKNDSLSSDEAAKPPPPIPSNPKPNPNLPELDQLRKFLKRGDALNTNTLKKLSEDKGINDLVKHDRSSASLYKTSRHLEFNSTDNPKQKEIKRIYLSGNKGKPKFTFRVDPYRHSKLSQEVQTDRVEATFMVDSRRDLLDYPQYPPSFPVYNYPNFHQVSYNTIDVIPEEQPPRKRQEKIIEETMEIQADDQEDTLLPIKTRRLISGRAKALSGKASVNTYLDSINKLDFEFRAGASRMPNRYKQYQQQQTIFSKTIEVKPLLPLKQTLNTFGEAEQPPKPKQPKVDVSHLNIQSQVFKLQNNKPSKVDTQQSQVFKLQNTKPVTFLSRTVNNQSKVQTKFQSKADIKMESKELSLDAKIQTEKEKPFTIPLVFTGEDVHFEKEASMIAEQSENEHTNSRQTNKLPSHRDKDTPSRVTDTMLSFAPPSPSRRERSPQKKQRQPHQNSILIQVPSLHELKVGEFQPKIKSHHPIRQSFGTNEIQWMKSQYHPKNELLQNMSSLDFQIKKYKNGVYFGQLDRQGKKHGKGIIFYFNGKIYEGEFVNDIKHGKGHEYYPDGGRYKGDFYAGMKQGRGVFEWSNGEVYDGQWEAGRKNGSGMWKGPNDESYIGEWKNGKVEGFGVFVMENGTRYEGEFKNSLKHGVGTERFNNGQTYVGSYQKNRPNGEGEYYWGNGDYYKGEFSNGLRHGNGYFKEGKTQVEYRGEYRNDKKCGYGEVDYGKGLVYVGNFENNFRHGFGELTEGGKQKYRGYWVNDHQVDEEFSPPKPQPQKQPHPTSKPFKAPPPAPTPAPVNAALSTKNIQKGTASRTTQNTSNLYNKTARTTAIHSIIEQDLQRQQSLPKLLPKDHIIPTNPHQRTHSQHDSPQCTFGYKRPCGCNKKH